MPRRCAPALKRSQSADRRAFREFAPQAVSLPGFIEFANPTLRTNTPSGDEWIHEIKWDGYRAQIQVAAGRAIAYSRSGLDWTDPFAAIVRAGEMLDAASAVLDGEVVVLGPSGRADFQALRRELGQPKSRKLLYQAFDLLWLDGQDLRNQPLLRRKERLKALLADVHAQLVYVDHFEGGGEKVYEHACRMQLEGIVSKRADSRYRSGRVESWIKTKCTKSATFPIVAFVEKLGAKPRRVASLYVGRWEGRQLLYAGKAQSGYTHEVAQDVREALDPFITKTSPLSVPVNKPKATWVEPVIQAEINYSTVTDDGILREAVFKGLRDDVAPRRKSAHKAAPPVGVPRENILQLLPDAVVPSKQELEAYWRKVAKRALEHLASRPLKLVRHTHSTTFYHKGPLPPIPSAVKRLRIQKREGGEGIRLWVDDLEGLLGLVDIGAVELHPWNARVDDIERADMLVVDLDPGKDVPWDAVIEAALAMRELLEVQGLETWPKLTGGKGLHLMAPLAQTMPHDQAHALARRLVVALADKNPRRYTVSAQAKRDGRIFLDYLRNGRGTTAVGAWSPRVRPGFPIAKPASWAQVERGIASDAFTMTRPFHAVRT